MTRLLRGRGQRGSSLVEFTLVGIPLIFILVSTFEMARGMWMYATMAYSVREAARFASVKGHNCAVLTTCSITVGDVIRTIEREGVALDRTRTNVSLITAATTITCNPMNTCEGNGALWPPATENDTGQPISITARAPFISALAMFWPGGAPRVLGTKYFTARANEQIQF